MSRWTSFEGKGAIGILQAKVKPFVIAQQFRCHARMIECLRKRFWHIGTLPDHAHSGHHGIMTRGQDR